MAMQLPPEVAAAVEQALGAPAEFRPLAGGINRRTFLAEAGGASWVVRSDPAPAHSLQRAVAAQARAEAAGVRVPHTAAHGLADGPGGPLFWCVETWHPGEPFDHERAGLPEARAAICNLARQLRCLHEVELDAFGDLPPRPYDVYTTAGEWIANKRRRAAAAVRLVGGSGTLASAAERAYDQIAGLYDGRPRLCKGDCAGGNLLVAGDRVTIVDWEWAQGLDPAADLAYWCRATPDPAARALLLAAYEPDDPPALLQRVQAYNIIHAVETTHVLDEHRDAFGADERAARLRAERQALELALASWLK